MPSSTHITTHTTQTMDRSDKTSLLAYDAEDAKLSRQLNAEDKIAKQVKEADKEVDQATAELTTASQKFASASAKLVRLRRVQAALRERGRDVIKRGFEALEEEDARNGYAGVDWEEGDGDGGDGGEKAEQEDGRKAKRARTEKE